MQYLLARLWPLCLAFVAAAAPLSAHAAAPVIVLSHPGGASFEQQLVHQALVQRLLGEDQATDVVGQRPLPPATRQACWLQRQGQAQLCEARTALQALHPERAAATAGMARQKLMRLAVLTGHVTPLRDALAVEAAAYLHAGARGAAGRVLRELLALQPDWSPDVSLYNPEMQRAVERARTRVLALPQRTLQLRSTAPQAALFVDGNFVGFDAADVEVTANQPHYVWALPQDGEPTGSRLLPRAPSGDNVPLTLTLAPRAAPAHAEHVDRYRSVYAASEAQDGIVDPSLPAVAATHAQDVWVLRYDAGALVLTHFDLVRGHRQVRRQTAIVTSLQEAHDAAGELLVGTDPTLTAPPTFKR